MKQGLKVAGFLFSLLLFSLGQSAFAAKEAKVTIVVRDVKLLPGQAEARPAAVNDTVGDDTGVRTGDQSRSELTFADLTITRLGANSVYNYNNAGRSVDLGGGSILLRVPKDSGGATVRAPAVSVAVTGTTFIIESMRGGRSKLTVLEGSTRISLNKNSSQKKNVRGGQMIDVPAGATTLPDPVNINLNQVMKTHPLIVNFPPLPSRDAIAQTAAQGPPPNEPVYQGTQVGGGGFPGISVGGFPVVGGTVGGGGGGGGGKGNPGHPGNTTTNPGNPGGNAGGGSGGSGGSGNPGKGGVSGVKGQHKLPTKKAPGGGPTIY